MFVFDKTSYHSHTHTKSWINVIAFIKCDEMLLIGVSVSRRMLANWEIALEAFCLIEWKWKLKLKWIKKHMEMKVVWREVQQRMLLNESRLTTKQPNKQTDKQVNNNNGTVSIAVAAAINWITSTSESKASFFRMF